MSEFSRRFESAHLSAPQTLLLSNGRYSVLLTTAASGYSRCGEIMVSRWSEDATCDAQGSYVFLRDVHDGRVWSAGYQPTGQEAEYYRVEFTEERAQFVRRDGPVVTMLTCCVAAGDDAELRRVSLSNEGRTARQIELTSYLEVVLASAAADAGHPAFAKMFVQTEFDPDSGALLALRRPRDAREAPLFAAHCLTLEGSAVGALQFETDRARFLGRGHDLRHAACVVEGRPLSNTAGTVLDPVLSLRRRVHLEPGETVHVDFWTGVATTRAAALDLVRRLSLPGAAARTLDAARTQALGVLGQLDLSAREAATCQAIGGRLLYADGSLRAPREALAAGHGSARALWPLGLSGDRPLLLLRLLTEAGLRLVTPLLRAQEYLRIKGLALDLAVLNEVASPGVQAALERALSAYRTHLAGSDVPRGAAAVIDAAHLERAGLDALRSFARIILCGDGTELDSQVPLTSEPAPRRRRRRESLQAATRAATPRTGVNLEFFNGLGGFAAEGREYMILLGEGQWTPAPWVNVIANPRFGFLASADGCGSTWYLNAQQNPLTPWSNDPVSNTPAEAVYLRDESNGDLWTATPLPMRDAAASYVVRHGFGYTRTEHASHGIALELTQFVPLADTLKIARLRLTNRCSVARRLSVTHYVDWVLGKERGRNAGIVTARHPGGALLARNPRSLEHGSQIAFLDAGGAQVTLTGDRAEFIGRHGSLAEPGALLGLEPLSNRVGAGLDPCGATQTPIDLAPGETRELSLLLGAADSEAQVTALLTHYRQANLDTVLREVTDFWDRTVGTLQVKSPDRSMDLLLNGWLLYQLIASRLWGRTAFYQSSGAYGYRDQLQDVMALCIAAPQETRAHLLRAAARQFIEGDVQHWWLPTTGEGIRTRIADDRLWLPYAVAHYLEVTGDAAVLDEAVPYLGGSPLGSSEQERFEAPAAALPPPESLYRHCVRALDSALAIGSHGLPLFGTGDWNDGMNRVGIDGRGESVWLGWFLHAALTAFAPLAARRGDEARAAEWRKHAHAVAQSIDREAWDGDWYRRGYFDDGTPLGSVTSEECRIDSVAQSWAVLSGGAPRARALQAMAAVNAQLVSRSDGLIKLFAPAFEHTAHDPGYIKAYPPGLRENGGQYTHGAIWNVLAFARLGNGERAAELFSLLNPVNHSSTRAGIHRYKVEPYVVCADVYAAPNHVGRGGWTWYTGSAGWMYRAGVEGLLGIQVRGNTLRVEPCIPEAWGGFEFTLKVGASRYRIEVDNRREPGAPCTMSLDGKEQPAGAPIALIDDGRYHYGKITLARGG